MKKILLLFLGLFMISGCGNKNLDIHSKLVQDLYSMVNPTEDGLILSDFYQNGGLSNNYMLTVALSDYIREQNENVKVISKHEIDKRVESIFGIEEVKHQKTYLLFDRYCGFTYNNVLEQYELILGCGGDMNQSFVRKLVRAREERGNIILTEKSIYVYQDWNTDYSHVTIYNNVVQKEEIDKFDNDSITELDINIDDYINYASTYEYTFEKVDDRYIFKGIKLVN